MLSTEKIIEIADQHSTPLYILDKEALENRINEIKAILGEGVTLCYAMKANPFFVDAFKHLNTKYEVCSPGEFAICEREKVNMKDIVLSGVNKEKADICHVLNDCGGVGVYTVESKEQYSLLSECAREAEVTIDVLLRVTSGNQFGLDPLFSCYQSYPQYWLEGEDGKVEYGSIQPETKTALENISKLYADGDIDPEMLVRSDSKEPLLAGKVGIFFGPWWCAYTFADTTLSGSADWRAYFTPLSEDGKYYTHMAEPTTQYVVASKDCKNPEAAFKIINYLIANEQTWVEEGVTSTEMGTADFYPLYNAYDNADEIETSYEVLTQYLAGEVGIDDVDFSTHKLLKNDMEAITELKKEPYDDFSLEYWNLDSDLAQGNLPRLVAIMVGDAPLVNEEYVPIYNVYNGQTETMEAKWANLKKMEEETFAKIIMGKADISEFDTFVENWKSQGGDQILKEINEELGK